MGEKILQPEQPQTLEEENIKQERLEAQQKTLSKLEKSGLSFLVFGGWAGKIEGVYDDDYYPQDIDIFINQNQWEEWQKFLEKNSFSVEMESNKARIKDGKTGAFVDGHFVKEDATGNFYIEEASHGTFHLPKIGFKKKELGESSVTVMRPELSWILEKGGPEREHKEEKLIKLIGKVDQENLEKIEKEFKYIPKKNSSE